MKYILNAFSLNMIEPSAIKKIRIEPTTTDEIRNAYVGGEAVNSCVGHESTAVVFEKLLNKESGSFIPISYNRQTIRLQEGDIAFVGQYVGERLPEGATTLPEGAMVDWFKVHCPAAPQKRVVVGHVNKFDFAAAYAAAAEELYDGEDVAHVCFTDRGFNGMGEFLCCTIITK